MVAPLKIIGQSEKFLEVQRATLGRANGAAKTNQDRTR